MGSTRLPGKSVMDIAGKPLVWHVVNRVCEAKLLDGVVLAIPEESNCYAIIEAITGLNVPVCIFPGDPNDLLYRYYTASSMFNIDTVVRIPADNPCIDPDEIDRIISFYQDLPQPVGDWLVTNLDQNVLGNGYPGGLGAEVYDASFIKWLYENVADTALREHPHIWARNNGRVKTIPAPETIARPDLRFDVNTINELEYIRGIYNGIWELNPDFRAADIIEYLDSRRLN